MSKFDILKESIKKYLPEILVGIGVTSLVTSELLTAAETVKATKAIDIRKKELSENDGEVELTVKETVKTAGKYYILPGLLTVGGVTCIIVGSKKRFDAFGGVASALVLTAEKKDILLDKIHELSPKKQEEVMDGVMETQMNMVEIPSEVTPGEGMMWAFDSVTCRYFRVSGIRQIEEAMISCQDYIRACGCMSVNEYCSELGLSRVTYGDYLGFTSIDDTTFDPTAIRYIKLKNGEPCLYIDVGDEIKPKYDYSSYA